MSSLAAARADNFYFPPDYDGRKHGGLSKFNGSKGANQWEQAGLIRFEMPMDSWCLGCERHMSRGLRFNAKKDKIGKYMSTILYSFTMKCPSCNNTFVIKTDPENDTYDFTEGIRKMEQDYKPDIEDGVIDILSDETKFQLANDPIYLMQHNLEGKIKAQTANERLEALIDLKQTNSKLDYDINSIMRAKNREKKEQQKIKNKESLKYGINVPLVDAVDEDYVTSKNANFAMTKYQRNVKQKEKRKIVEIQSQSIFADDNKKKKKKSNNKSSEEVMKKSTAINIDNFKTIGSTGNDLSNPRSIVIKTARRIDIKDKSCVNNSSSNSSSSSSSSSDGISSSSNSISNNILQSLQYYDD